MSVSNISNSDMIHNKSFQFHHRKASKELEVFEATRYFSEYNEASSAAASANFSSTKFTQKVKKKKDKGWIKGRISLDMNLPMKNILNLPPQNISSANYSNSFDDHQKPTKEKMIKLINKQPKPSSPGGKLASFLKKMIIKTKSPIQSMELDNNEENHDHDHGQENSKRRISISHLQTPTKSYKEFLSFSKFNRHLRSAMALPKSSSAAMDERRNNKVEMDEKCKLRDGVLEKQKKKKNDFEKFNETDDDDDDDGNETDSSSDLFELQIYDLDYYSNGLPVYESTDIDSIKRRNSISNILH